MSDTLRQVIGGVPRDQIEHDVYDGRRGMNHWLLAWSRKTGLEARAETLTRQLQQALPPALLAQMATELAEVQRQLAEPFSDFHPLNDEIADKMLAAAESYQTVPAEAAAAYRELIVARALAEPGANPTDTDAEWVRERYGVVRAWLETQG